MAITPYNLSTDLGSVFEDMFRPLSGWGGRLAGTNLMRAPEADVVETEDRIRVVVELPGIHVNDVEVNLENNVLTVSGEKKEEHQDERDTWHISERRYGRFSRSFVLPRDVDQDRIEARFENGVLQVTIPKTEQARRRKIEVRNGGDQQRVEATTGGGK